MLNKKYILLIPVFVLFSITNFAQDDFHDSLMNKYNNYRERLEKEFVIVSPDVEVYGYNIPAVDRLIGKWGKNHLSWSDANSNYNNYISFLITEIELLKRNNKSYEHSLKTLLYGMFALERLDLYSEYNLRVFHDKKIHHNGDSISDYIRYPADINGFMLRDDVSIGFWKYNHQYFGFDFGEIDENMYGTNKYESIFKSGAIPLQGMSQDVIIHTLEAMALLKHFGETECIKDIELRFINDLIPKYLRSKNILRGDSIDFKLWAEDVSLRFLNNLQRPYKQSSLVWRPWYVRAKIKPVEFLSMISTRWYIINPILEKPVRRGSGNDLGLMVNAHGFAETVSETTGRNDLHLEGSDSGFLRFLFRSAYYKEIKLPLGGAISLPSDWDDNKIRSLAAFGNVDGNYTPVFNSLRTLGDTNKYQYYILTNYLLNRDRLENIYNPEKKIWKQDSTYFANLLAEAPPEGPFSDTCKHNYTVNWSTSSRIVWPADKPTHRGAQDWEYAGMDYLMLHNLYRLVYNEGDYNIDFNNSIKNKSMFINTNSKNARKINKKIFLYAPVTESDKDIKNISP